MISFSYTMQIGNKEYIKIGLEKSFPDTKNEDEAFEEVYNKVMEWSKSFVERPSIELRRKK
jgi:hypothetical protein